MNTFIFLSTIFMWEMHWNCILLFINNTAVEKNNTQENIAYSVLETSTLFYCLNDMITDELFVLTFE